MKRWILSLVLVCSGSAFGTEKMCYTMTGDAGFVSALSAFIINDLGLDQYSISMKVWTKGDDQTVTTDLGAYSCLFKDGSEGFTGLFTCNQPENERTKAANTVRSICEEVIYSSNGHLKTSVSYKLDAYLPDDQGYPAVKHVNWDQVRCDANQTFDQVVEEFRYFR